MALTTPRSGLLPGTGGVVDPEGNNFHPISMLMDMFGNRMLRTERGGEDKTELVLAYDIAHRLTVACLRTAIGQRLESKGRLVIVGSLFGIANIEFNIVGPLQRQEIIPGGWLLTGIGSS